MSCWLLWFSSPASRPGRCAIIETFGKFIFIRDNFGAELRLGNGPGADGTWMQYLHPTQDVYAMRQYTAMGELAYIEMRKQQAVDYIKADYPRFAVLA